VIRCFSVHDPDGADADLSETDVEDEVAEAEARAEAARARLEKLRGSTETDDPEDGADAAQDALPPAKSIRARLRLPRRPRLSQRPRRPRWLRRPGRKAIAAGVGAVLFFASLGASGYMLWQHRTAVHNRQLAAEFTAAARQGVTALLSIDPEHARRDVQAMLDATTGDLNSQLAVMSALMVAKAEDSKVGSKVSVEGVAVESLSDNSGVMLVAAKTDTTGPDNAKPPPALFRLSVTISRDGGKLKMSKVDYLE
jgi:Mce-associated membrane protein